jgi:hypothetical protein
MTREKAESHPVERDRCAPECSDVVEPAEGRGQVKDAFDRAHARGSGHLDADASGEEPKGE